MLVITRYKGEDIIIGDTITVKVLSFKGNRVVIGIDAPPGVNIKPNKTEGVGGVSRDANSGQLKDKQDEEGMKAN